MNYSLNLYHTQMNDKILLLSFFLFFLSSSYSSFSINTIMVSQREVHTDQAITFLQALLAKAFCLDKNKTNK